MIYKGRTGQQYNLASTPFAQGGEGVIYNVSGNQDIVVKLYKSGKNDAAKERKLIKMVNNPPNNKALSQIAWPLDVIYDANRKFVGFTMPKLAKKEDLNVIYEYGDTAKYKNLPWNFKIVAAKNLCAVLSAVHTAGHVVGDLNPRNISVDPQNGHIAFFDADSFHITDNGTVYRCNVGMPEYLAPEIQRKLKTEKYSNGGGKKLEDLSLPTFTRNTDNFALAIHIFQLLMNGTHPFACRVLPSQASVVQPQPTDNILKGLFPFMQSKAGIDIPIYAPPITILPLQLQNLFRKAFIDGFNEPNQRPKPEDWHSALCELEKELTNCNTRTNHCYYKFLKQCPWCQIDNKFKMISTGRIPNSSPAKPAYHPPIAPRPQSPAIHAQTKKRHPVVRTFSLLIPITAFIAGQVIQYCLYSKLANGNFMGIPINQFPLWILIITTLASATATILTCYNSWNLASNSKIGDSWSLASISSAGLALLPCIFGLPILICSSIITRQRVSYSDEFIPIAPTVISFFVGQILLYWGYIQSGYVTVLTGLIEISDAYNFNLVAFLVITTIIGAAATGIMSYLGYYFVDNYNKGNAYFALVPFNLLMITLPTLSAIPLFIVSVVLICAKKIGHIRVLAIVLLAISVLSVGVAGIVDWAIDTTQYTVTLDFNGGTCETNEILVRYGKKMPLIEAPEKTGYIFEGYFDSIDGGKQYYYSDMTSASKWDKKEDSTLYAHWDAKKFTITFDKQGGENGSNSVTAIYGKPMPAATAPQRSGYSFQGYYTSTNIKYYDSQMNSLRNWDRTENLTLYARWESTLSLSVSPGSISDLSGSTTITLTASGGSGNYTFRIDNNPSGISCSLSGNKLTVTKKDNNASGSIRIVVKDNTYGTTATRNISYTTSGCVAAGTLVTMADGSYKKIEDVCAGDIILSWNFITGQIEAVPVSLYWNHGEDNYKVLNLEFSDDVHVRVINTHGFFDYLLNKFVYITNDNYADYINHEFAYLDMTGLKKVKLLSVTVSEEIVGCYSLRTACNDNAVVSGLLSLTWEDYAGMLTYFEVGEDMKYDAQKMQADIEAYGLYYYDEWSEYVTYEEFIALNGQYFKILVGKGILREEDIIGLIEGMRN